jgi:hypothetical protein
MNVLQRCALGGLLVFGLGACSAILGLDNRTEVDCPFPDSCPTDGAAGDATTGDAPTADTSADASTGDASMPESGADVPVAPLDAGNGDAPVVDTGSATSDAEGGPAGCPGGEQSCGGTCVNLSGNDANNCGACGHSCFGGACVTGTCQAFLVVQPPTTSAVAYIGTDGANVIWHDYNLSKLQQISAAGGSIITLDATATEGYALGGGKVLFLGGQGLMFATIGVANSGTKLTTAISSLATMNPGGTRYWKEQVLPPNDQISDCPIGGGSCVAYAGFNYTTSPIYNLVADNSYMFLCAAKTIYMEAIGSGNWIQFENRNLYINQVATDGTYVYWNEGVYNMPGTVYRASEQLLGTPQHVADGIALFATDGTNIYYPDSSATHMLSAPADGSGAAIPLTPIAGCSRLAVAGKLLIWLNAATIYGLALP